MADLGAVGVGLVFGWSTVAPRRTRAKVGLAFVSVGTAAAITRLPTQASLAAGLGALAGGAAMHALLDVALQFREKRRVG